MGGCPSLGCSTFVGKWDQRWPLGQLSRSFLQHQVSFSSLQAPCQFQKPCSQSKPDILCAPLTACRSGGIHGEAVSALVIVRPNT